MKSAVLSLFLVFSGIIVMGQSTADTAQGLVSYVTSQHVYVRFPSTSGITAGDTLWMKSGGKMVPVMTVSNLSSLSCVGDPLPGVSLNLSDRIIHLKRIQTPHEVQQPSGIPEGVARTTEVPVVRPAGVPDTTAVAATPPVKKNQVISGYFAVASYSNFSDAPAANTQKMKYTLSLNIRNIGKTNLTFESYLSFNHSNINWNDIQNDLFNGLKIYNLSLGYEFSRHFSLLLGRKINPKISNMGAVDGLQFEMRFRPISIGILAGSRPDYRNYGFNFSLLQYGIYIAQENTVRSKPIQTTLAFIKQDNSGNTDRMFAHLQHSNTLIPKVTFYGSLEVDLYRKIFNTEDSSYSKSNSPKVSNLYLSLTYRVIRPLSVSFSYSARQNVIYYETYKNYLDRLLDPQTLQGFMLQINARPVNRLMVGVTGGYRFEQADPRPTGNVYVYATYSQIPVLNIAATGSFTWLKTSYLTGKIYSIGVTKDLFRGRLSGGLTYRYVGYDYSGDYQQVQNLAEASLSWRIWRKFALTVYNEGTFGKDYQYNRIYAQASVGF